MTRRLLAVLCLCLALPACAGRYGVRPADPAAQLAAWEESALRGARASQRSLLYLQRHDLLAAWKADPQAVLLDLDERLRAAPDRDTLFALMELCHLAAKQPGLEKDLAGRLFLSSAVYAYGFLFDEQLDPEPDDWTPYRRMACDFYNLSLAQAARGAIAGWHIPAEAPLLRGSLRPAGLRLPGGREGENISRVLLAYDYQAVGLDSQVRAFGLGVPLIVERAETFAPVGGESGNLLPQSRQIYPATAVVRLSGQVYRQPQDVPVAAEILVLHPAKTLSVAIGGKDVPLETDLSTPLAYMLDKMPAQGGFLGLRRVAEQERIQGLYLLEPFDPDKIPVVFVHGLLSSPRTWVPMFNELMADPVLRLRYQFWFYMYPTGKPILASAADLRRSLDQVRARHDPAGTNENLRRMVLVGHSMGGLLSKFMVQDGGEPLWSSVSAAPLDSLNLPRASRDLLEDAFFFSRRDCVTRAVFLATPHRGADMADNSVGKLGSLLVKLPGNLLSASTSLIGAMSGQGNAALLKRIGKSPTGIDGLSPDNPVLAASAAAGVSPRVVFHSIIGNREAPVPGGSDGIVPYASSHLDGAASEIVVRSEHGVHTHPLAILEVRRILLEHLGE